MYHFHINHKIFQDYVFLLFQLLDDYINNLTINYIIIHYPILHLNKLDFCILMHIFYQKLVHIYLIH